MTKNGNSIVRYPPPPWKRLPASLVGGLLQVGFAENSNLIIVLSHSGRGIFDCRTGASIARDYDETDAVFDTICLTVQGFGLLAGQPIRTAGLYGGGLPLSTADGWFLKDQVMTSSIRSIVLAPPHRREQEDVVIGNEGICELRAFGFSDTGLSLLIATSCDLMLFTR